MTTPKNLKPGRKQNSDKRQGHTPSAALLDDLKRRMENCPTAEQLNSEVITPFIRALVSVCDARGYVLNVYGEHCNLAITPEDHAEDLFRLIESYLDESDLG